MPVSIKYRIKLVFVKEIKSIVCNLLAKRKEEKKGERLSYFVISCLMSFTNGSHFNPIPSDSKART